MASIAIALGDICGGNTHAHMNMNVDAGALVINGVLINRNEIMTPLTMAEAADVLTMLIRIHCRGMTAAQVKAALQAGWTSTV